MDSKLQFPKHIILSISDDVLDSIFSFLTEHSDPVSLSHVCKNWRKVALALPVLWSTIILNKDNYSIPSSADRITTFLTRSKSRPLTLDFNIKFDRIRGQVLLDIFRLVLPHAGRWRYFYLSTNDYGSVNYLYYEIRDLSVPLLKHFSVDLSHPTGYDSPIRLNAASLNKTPIFTKGSPSLSTFRGLGETPSRLQPDLSNITSLYLRDLPWTVLTLEYFRTILSLPELECLSLHGTIDSDFWNVTPSQCQPTITAHRLKHLHFAIQHSSAFQVLLYTLNAPRLKSLFLVGAEITGDSEGFAAKHFPEVIHLRFLRCGVQMAIIAGCATFFRMFPSVKFLAMNGGRLPLPVSQLLLVAVPGDSCSQMKSETLPDLLALTCEDGAPRDLISDNGACTAKWRDGLMVNPTPKQLKKLEGEHNLPEAGWDQDFRFPPDPLEYDERLYISERYYFRA